MRRKISQSLRALALSIVFGMVLVAVPIGAADAAIRAGAKSFVAYTLLDIWIAFAFGFYYHEFMFCAAGKKT